MATPPDQIQLQHEEGWKLVQEHLPFAKAKSHEEIPLTQKLRPLYEYDNIPQCYDQPCWTTRGYIDVNKLQALVTEGYNLNYDNNNNENNHRTSSDDDDDHNNKQPQQPQQPQKQRQVRYTEADVPSKTNLWDPRNAAVFNVSICRPSHDAWGIHKIVFLFCDDFLQRTYALPWWYGRTDIREAVQPIFRVLNISPDCVVRMLLASLPPGVTIPVHEDSGAWVSKTHRVHVPILVRHPDQILFRCGPTVDTMERIATTPGHVFEINNQAKHAVSNFSSDYRVHLILDYVDPDYVLPPRILLEPGESLIQTRRSIDRFKDRGTRPTPSFIILGAQKGGTTSLYEYMVQHPLIVRAKRRETHCLDWRWNPKLSTTDKQRKWCHRFFHINELHRHPSCLTGDSTPSYLLDSLRVIPRLKQVFPWPLKFFVMLRNPIKRAESHYAMVTSTEGTPEQLQARGSEWRQKSFPQVVQDDLEKMRECGLIPYWNIDQGTLDEDVFQSFCGSEKEDRAWDCYLKQIPLNTGSHSLLARGMYALNLRPWFRAFDHSDFLVLQLEKFESEGVNHVMEKVWAHVGVPSYRVMDDNAKNTRSYGSFLDHNLRSYLERFYEPHNRRLANLLGEEWNGAWVNQDQENSCPQ